MPDRRIIAIAVTPKAYDEVIKLKGDQTWTHFVLDAIERHVGGNEVLKAELEALPKKAEPKPKPEKKAKVKKVKAEPTDVGGTPEDQAEEAKAITEGLPSDVPGGDCPGFPAEG